jgi:RNA polymerase sigma factor (sigma-70 family)
MRHFLTLWRSAQRLDPVGFEALLRPHLDHLYRTAVRLTGQRQEAEDLLQELLLRLYSRRHVLPAVEELEPWLKKSLYNLFVQRWRSAARTPFSRLDPGYAESQLESIQSPDPSPEALTAQFDDRQMLLKGLEQLSNEHRAVLIAHDVEGLSQIEVGDLLRIPVGTVKSRLFRARKALRAQLESGNQIEAASVLVREDA